MSRSTRASARRTVLAHVGEVKSTLTLLTGWWTVRATVFERLPEDEATRTRSAALRERRQEEYPEAQARYWASTVAEIDRVTEELDRFRAFAVAEFHKCEKGD